jgi:hypothetical protein
MVSSQTRPPKVCYHQLGRISVQRISWGFRRWFFVVLVPSILLFIIQPAFHREIRFYSIKYLG